MFSVRGLGVNRVVLMWQAGILNGFSSEVAVRKFSGVACEHHVRRLGSCVSKSLLFGWKVQLLIGGAKGLQSL